MKKIIVSLLLTVGMLAFASVAKADLVDAPQGPSQPAFVDYGGMFISTITLGLVTDTSNYIKGPGVVTGVVWSSTTYTNLKDADYVEFRIPNNSTQTAVYTATNTATPIMRVYVDISTNNANGTGGTYRKLPYPVKFDARGLNWASSSSAYNYIGVLYYTKPE